MAASIPTTTRDLRLDSLRGLMLIMMTVNHLPSVLSHLTDEPFGVASSAEGFVFLSGLLAGIVYTRRLRRDGGERLWEATRGRANMIWRWQAGSFLAALACVHLVAWVFRFDSEKAPVLFYAHPWLSVLMGCTFLYQPGMLDILPMYCALVSALPWVLEQLERGRKWIVLGGSALLWLSVQSLMGSSIDGAPLYPLHVGSFNLLAWQFIFFLGVAIGHEKAAKTEEALPFRPWLFALALAVAVYGWGVQHRGWVPPGWSDPTFGIMINKTALGLFRLADFGAIAYLIATFGKHFPRLLTWRPVAFLGQHSIAVFGVQSVVGIVMLEFWWLFSTPVRNWITTLVAIGLLWISAALHQKFGRKVTVSPQSGQAGPWEGLMPAAATALVQAGREGPMRLTPRNDIRAA